MSRNKAIKGEKGFVGHFYWTGDDLNQVQNKNKWSLEKKKKNAVGRSHSSSLCR